MRARRRALSLVAVSIALSLPAAAGRDRQRGDLAQPAGAAGCIVQGGGEGCAAGRGLRSVAGIAMSPDGRNVYAAAEGSAALAVMARVARSGALRQLPGALGCVSAAGAEGCARGRNLAVARAVAVSRDGRTVYVATAGGLAVFARSPRDGTLRQLAGRAGCVSESGSDGCARVRAVSKARGVASGRRDAACTSLGSTTPWPSSGGTARRVSSRSSGREGGA